MLNGPIPRAKRFGWQCTIDESSFFERQNIDLAFDLIQGVTIEFSFFPLARRIQTLLATREKIFVSHALQAKAIDGVVQVSASRFVGR